MFIYLVKSAVQLTSDIFSLSVMRDMSLFTDMRGSGPVNHDVGSQTETGPALSATV